MATHTESTTSKFVFNNPLSVLGLIFLTGDGPLVLLFTLSKDNLQAWTCLIATIVFTIGMGILFGYLVISRPRNLYDPKTLASSLGKPIYNSDKVFDEAKALVTEISNADNFDTRNQLAESLKNQLNIAQDLQTAYSLLMSRGYDVSLILDILEDVKRNNSIDYEFISLPLNITPATIINIETTMINENILEYKKPYLYLTDKGTKLIDGLRIYLNRK
jgi:hypothetical protein